MDPPGSLGMWEMGQKWPLVDGRGNMKGLEIQSCPVNTAAGVGGYHPLSSIYLVCIALECGQWYVIKVLQMAL